MTIDEAVQHKIFDDVRNLEDFHFPEGQEFDISLPSEMPMETIKEKMNLEIRYYSTDMDIEDFTPI